MGTLADMRRDNDIDSERGYESWHNLRSRNFRGQPAYSVFRDGLPDNMVNAILTRLPGISVVNERKAEPVGIPPVDVLLGIHGHANPFTRTAVVNPQNATEEVTHLVDMLPTGGRFTDRPDYRDAVQKGTARMAEEYLRPYRSNKRGVAIQKLHPDNGRMRQLLREDPDSPYYDIGSKRPGQESYTGVLGSHGPAYELANQLTDFPKFERRAAAMKESLPAIMELPPDTARKYYPEALKIIDNWLDSFPLYEGEARTANPPKQE